MIAAVRAMRAANDNVGRRVIVRLTLPDLVTTAEIEVFGTLLDGLELTAANDNTDLGDAA